MKKEKYMDDELFYLSVLVGNWESVNLYPTVIIYRNGDTYLLSLIHMNEMSKQASPTTYEIQEDENGYFISYNLKRCVFRRCPFTYSGDIRSQFVRPTVWQV